MASEQSKPLTAIERETRIIEALLALASTSDSGFEASYESLGEITGIEPHHVQSLCQSMKRSTQGRNDFLDIKMTDKGGLGPRKKTVRRFIMFYPDRDARWHMMMRSLGAQVFGFAVMRDMLDSPPDEIEKAYCLHAEEVARASEILGAAEGRRPDRFSEYDDDDSDERPDETSEIVERLDRIESLLRQLVKARAFQDRVVPFDEDA
jgi:hypothetical protein